MRRTFVLSSLATPFLTTLLCALSFAVPAMAQDCKLQLSWECFNTSVAIVGRAADGRVVNFCSGVAIDTKTVMTAGHCIESLSHSLFRADVEIQIYRRAVVDFKAAPDAIADRDSLHLDRLYNRERSYFHRDRGLIKLTTELQAHGREVLHFPKVRRGLGPNIEQAEHLHRVGFGRRLSSDGIPENRRTWITAQVHSVYPETLVTQDKFAMPGDSGGPVLLHVPGEGLFLIGLHSTLDKASGFVYSPRVL